MITCYTNLLLLSLIIFQKGANPLFVNPIVNVCVFSVIRHHQDMRVDVSDKNEIGTPTPLYLRRYILAGNDSGMQIIEQHCAKISD